MTAPPPLEGVRVLDLSRLVAGNQLTMLLGDFGAEVIKVEQPRVGDSLRHWLTGGQELHWKVYGRNKKSVTLDLKQDAGRELLLRLAADAQILVEGFRPGALDRLGLAPKVLHQVNPAMVIGRISGWGQTGSMAEQPGFGTLIEAMSGFAAATGFADREPVLPPGALADMIAGTFGAFAAVTALRHAERTGVGQEIDLSLFEPLFSVLGPHAAAYARTGQVARRTGSRSQTSAPRNVYRTKDDKWLALSASTQAMTRRLFTAMGRPDLLEDPRFADNAARLRNVEELDGIVGAYFGEHTLEENLATMAAAGVTVGPVSDISQLLGGEFFTSRQVVVTGPDVDDAGGVPMHNVVPRLSATPGRIGLPAPRLGQHNREILGPLVTEQEWTELELGGVIGS